MKFNYIMVCQIRLENEILDHEITISCQLYDEISTK